MGIYTNLIFKNRKIFFDTSNNENHKVLALEDIGKGDILLIEHMASNIKLIQITNYIKHNKELFDSLYPRTIKYEYEDRYSNKEKELEELAIQKTEKNVFYLHEKNYYAIGVYISKFNHNKNSNTSMRIANTDPRQKQLTYVVIVANEDIQKNNEITINYGKNYFNELDCVDIPQSIELSDTMKNIIYKYMNKQAFYEIHKNLVLADCNGIYLYDNDKSFITRRALQNSI